MVHAQNLFEYFFYPKATGYDVPKTIIYSAILVVAIYLIFLALKKLKVKIDQRLFVGIAPYIGFGATLRVLQDAGIVNSFLFVTPGIYFLVFSIFFVLLLICLFIEKKRGIYYFKILFLIGLLLFAFSLAFIRPINFEGVFLVIVFYLPWLAMIYLFKKWSSLNRAVLSVQVLDANITFISINFFGFGEQHVLPTFLMNLFGPISFVFVKLIAIITILVLIDRISKDKEFNNYLKLIIAILGASTATRDFIALSTFIG